MDVVYVVRQEELNESLRFSLRSLSRLPHNKVYIAGYCPDWAKGVRKLLRDQTNIPDQENSNANLLLAIQDERVSDDFIFMNDDFFILQPTLAIEPMHQGLLDDRIASYRVGDRFHQAYSLIRTREALWELKPGQELYSYELHMPMVMNKAKLLKLFNAWRWPLFALRPRTMYGNAYNLKGTLTKDAKGSTNPQDRYISTVAGFTGLDAACVKSAFPARSKYERLPAPAAQRLRLASDI